MDGEVRHNTQWPSGEPFDPLTACALTASLAFILWIVLQH